MRDDHLHGSDSITPNTNKPAPIAQSTIATSSSASPYKGDAQHEYVHGGIGEAAQDVVNGIERGIITPKGTGISVTESDGAEVVSINHHSGAGIQIGTDGTVVITSTSRGGLGMNVPNGDIGIGGNVVSINARGAVSIKTNGSLTLDVGRDLIFNVGGTIITNTNGVSETNNGSEIREIVKDRSVIVAGNNRSTIGGDSREQYSGKATIESEGDLTIASNGTTAIHAGDDFVAVSGGDSYISSEGDVNVKSTGDLFLDGAGDTSVKAGGGVFLDGGSVHSSPPIDLADYANRAKDSDTAPTTGPGAGSKPAEQSGSSAGGKSLVEAEVMAANDIIDEISSIRVLPEYPGNALNETEEMGSIGLNETDPVAEQAYNQFSSNNFGSRSPVYSEGNGEISTTSGGGSYNQIPNDAVAQDVQGDIPSSDLNTNERVSGVSLSELTGAPFSHRIPASQRAEILKAHAVVMQNIIAPLRAAGFNFTITSAYRGNSPNHRSGYAIDLQSPGRVFSNHVAIAEYAARNLPCAQVFLERSGSGYSHVHIRAHPPGSSGSATLLTCGDPRCSTKVGGIQGEWLKRRGVKG